MALGNLVTLLGVGFFVCKMGPLIPTHFICKRLDKFQMDVPFYSVQLSACQVMGRSSLMLLILSLYSYQMDFSNLKSP